MIKNRRASIVAYAGTGPLGFAREIVLDSSSPEKEYDVCRLEIIGTPNAGNK